MKKAQIILVFLGIIFPAFLFAQVQKQDVWSPFRFFIGEWKGKGTVEGMDGKYERTYRFIFNGKYIEAKNKSTFQPNDKNPKGEIHEDLGYISYDKGRKLFVLRQLHVEGFVNQYKLDSISKDGKTIVFTSEAIENIPVGWRARETYQLTGDNEFTETFALAEPNKPFETYSKVIFKRSVWHNWNWLLGEWEGEGSGQPGKGSGSFSFTKELDNNIIVRTNHTELPAADNKPAAVHEDRMIVYLDATGNPSKAIYFDNEGHTINYQVSYSDKSIILTSEKMDNMPIFRLVYTLLDDGEVNTKFEMSRDGKQFMTYLEGKSRKIK